MTEEAHEVALLDHKRSYAAHGNTCLVTGTSSVVVFSCVRESKPCLIRLCGGHESSVHCHLSKNKALLHVVVAKCPSQTGINALKVRASFVIESVLGNPQFQWAAFLVSRYCSTLRIS